MTKRPSLFGAKPQIEGAPQPEAATPAEAAPAPRPAVSSARYPKATTREGKRAVTAYVDPAAFRQLKRIAADEDAQMQVLVTEALNLLFEKRGLSRIA